MDIGIFARTFEYPTLTEVLDAVQSHDINCIQFNMLCVGLPSMPDYIDEALSDTIRKEMAARQIKMGSLSGTFNMIHPNIQERQNGLRQLGVLIAVSERLGSSILTLCTGTRNPESMWRKHPDNNSPEAWRDLLDTMESAVKTAEVHNVVLAFEPEIANVVDSAQKARRLLDEIQSPHLKVVIDGANIFHDGELAKMHDILDEAFELLADDIVIAHAKDLDRDGEAGHLAAGTGLLDYDHYISLLQSINFNGPFILHGLAETQVPWCLNFIRGKLGGG